VSGWKAPAACIAVGRFDMNFDFWITLGLGIVAKDQRLSS
jgi:hypothetical protein